jgi:hypothetical protein
LPPPQTQRGRARQRCDALEQELGNLKRFLRQRASTEEVYDGDATYGDGDGDGDGDGGGYVDGGSDGGGGGGGAGGGGGGSGGSLAPTPRYRRGGGGSGGGGPADMPPRVRVRTPAGGRDSGGDGGGMGMGAGVPMSTVRPVRMSWEQLQEVEPPTASRSRSCVGRPGGASASGDGRHHPRHSGDQRADGSRGHLQFHRRSADGDGDGVPTTGSSGGGGRAGAVGGDYYDDGDGDGDMDPRFLRK